MNFIIYETTNLKNGKKYRGAHVCKSLDDDYLGSGKLLKKAIAKYGIQNFERKVLLICDSLEHMFEQECIFVDDKWVEDCNTYNLKIGGEGGWDYINREGKRWNEEKRRLHSIEMKKKRMVGEWGPKTPSNGFKNKKHTEETKQKISKNNGSSLSYEEIEKRISQWNSLEDVRGKITKISKLWKVSHTQVARFVKKFNLSVV